MHHNSSGRSAWDGIALLGFLILAIVVIWGAVHAARLAAPYFTSFFPNKAPSTIEITAPKEVVSGTPFSIRWDHKPTSEGKYIFLYQCRSGLKFQTTERAEVPCGAAFPIATEGVLDLVPDYTGESSLQVPVSIVFIPEKRGALRSQGGVTLSVLPSSKEIPDATKPETPRSPTSTKKSGKADIAVTIIAIGVIHPITGQFLNIAPTSAADIAAVQFDIANVGSASTGGWSFEASLPTTGGFMYFSPPQAPLQPGDHVVNTLRFTDVAPGGGIISIQADPINTISEVSEGNNYASQHIYMHYYASPYIY